MSKSLATKSKPGGYAEQAEFATKHDIDLVKMELKHDIDLVKMELRQDIDLVKMELRQDIDLVKKDIRWLKWVMALGFGTLLSLMVYLHSDTKADIRELRIDMKELNKKMEFIIQELKK